MSLARRSLEGMFVMTMMPATKGEDEVPKPRVWGIRRLECDRVRGKDVLVGSFMLRANMLDMLLSLVFEHHLRCPV